MCLIEGLIFKYSVIDSPIFLGILCWRNQINSLFQPSIAQAIFLLFRGDLPSRPSLSQFQSLKIG